MKSMKLLGAIALIFAVSMMSSAAFAVHPTFGGAHPVIYVTSQDLCYTSIVLTGLPPRRGPFQLLVPGGGPTGADLNTEFGIGDVGYLGGRWWVDMDSSGTMNAGDEYFMCPLTNEVTCPAP